MRLPLCAFALLLLGACKSKSVPDTGPCQRAQLDFWGAEPLGSKPRESVTCSELYRHKACGDAWRAELVRSDKVALQTEVKVAELPDASRILTACAKAYCAELGSKPLACNGPAPTDNAKLVAALYELDGAILSAELQDPLLGATLARRARLFQYVMMPNATKLVGGAEPPDAKVVTVELSADGSARLDGKAIDLEQLEAELTKLGAPDALRATIAADRHVEHGRVIHTLDLLRRAGIKKIAFAVSPSVASSVSSPSSPGASPPSSPIASPPSASPPSVP